MPAVFVASIHASAVALDVIISWLLVASWPFGPTNWTLIELVAFGLLSSFAASIAIAVTMHRRRTPESVATALGWVAFVVVSEAMMVLQLRHASRCGMSYEDVARILGFGVVAGLPAAWLAWRTSRGRRWQHSRLAVLAPVLACLSALAFVGYVAFFYVNAWCLPADAEF